MADLASAVAGAVGQPASVRIGKVESVTPLVISAQDVTFGDVGLLGAYRPRVGDTVVLLGQCSGTGTDPASWLALGAPSTTPSSQVLLTQFQRNAVQSIANSTFVAMSWDAIVFDNMGGFTAAGFVAPFDGWFEFTGRATFGANATGQRQALWYHLGSSTESFVNMQATSALGARLGMKTHYINMLAGQDVNMRVFQNSGAALNTEASSGVFPQMAVRYIGNSVS